MYCSVEYSYVGFQGTHWVVTYQPVKAILALVESLQGITSGTKNSIKGTYAAIVLLGQFFLRVPGFFCMLACYFH